MAAYLRDITRTCDRQGCPKQATVELRNTWNAVIGQYCAPHGNRALKDFQRDHEKQEAR